MTGATPGSDSYVVSSLVNNRQYHFQVRAVNASGDGVPTAPLSAAPVNAVPSKTSYFWVGGGDGQVSMRWNLVREWTNKWEYSIDNGATWTDVPGSHNATLSYTVPNLTNGSVYTFRVRGVNDAGNGVASDPAIVGPIPAQPTGFTASRGDLEVVLHWGRPRQQQHHALRIPAEDGRLVGQRLDAHTGAATRTPPPTPFRGWRTARSTPSASAPSTARA